MPKVQDEAVLDISDYLKKLDTIDKNIAKMAGHADKSFGGVSKSAQLSGVQIGAVGGVVGALTTKFLELGQRAIAELGRIGKESVDLAGDLEVTEKVFTGIFQGNKKAALAALGELRKESRALGVDLGDTAAAFLPFVSSLEQLERLGKIKTALELAQPEQKAQGGGRIALQEALSGDITSLVRRFEIPKSLAKELKAALDEGGVEAFLGKFEEVLKTLGRDLDTLGGGLQQAQGKAQIAGAQIQEAFGGPVVDELTEQFNALADVINNNFDDFELIADTFGRVLANIVEIVGSGLTDFLAGLDTEQAIEIAEAFYDLVENGRALADILIGVDFADSFVDNLQFAVDKLNEALETAIKLSLLAQAEIAKQQAEQAVLNEALGSSARRGAFGQISFGQASEEDEARAVAAGQAAHNKVIQDGLSIIEESTKRKEDNRRATDELREAQQQGTEAGLNEADAFLAQRDAAEALEDALNGIADAEAETTEKTTKALEKNQQAVEDATTDHERKLVDIQTDATRKRLDAAQDFADRRVDLARSNLQKIADLEQEFERDLEKSSLTLARDIEDAERDAGRAKIEQAKSEAQEQLDIELNHQRRLFDIRKRFDADLSEFERTRDTVGYLRAIREREQEISEAQTDRQRSIEDTRLEGEQKRQELQTQLQQQLEDARIADSRRREDALIALEQGLEDQRENYSRQQEELALAESRKAEEIRLWQERQIEDANLAHERRLSDLQLALDRELAAIKAAEEAKRLEYQKTVDAAKAALAELQAAQAAANQVKPAAAIPPSLGKPKFTGEKPLKDVPGFQHGGLVNAGQPVMVGERGPELFQPSMAGKIIPNSALVLPNFGSKSVVSNISNVREGHQINIPDAAGLLNNPIAMRQIENIVLSMLDRTL